MLQVLPALETGGVERGTVDIAAALAEAGWEPWVASSGGPMVRELARIGARHVTLPLDRKNPITVVRNVDRLAKLIETEDIDIVHARSRAPAWSALVATRRTKRPLITTYHGTYNAGGRLKLHYNSVMARGDRVIAISQFVGDHVRDTHGTGEKRLRVVPRGIDLERFDPAKVRPDRMIRLARKWRLPDDRAIIMLPARLTRWKGHAVLIEALAQLERRDVRCLLIGADQGRRHYYRYLLDLIDQRRLEEIVQLVGHCDDMPAALMLSDAVVSPSTDPEAFGRVVVEAQAMGRPTIASDHGGPRETVIAGETGLLVPPKDAKALAAALDEVLGLSAGARAILAERAIAHVRAAFSKPVMCARTLDVYRELLPDPARRRPRK